ncbi:MAG: hypothetical protein ACI97A_002414 [Planctomycetota bacterium]|jgi:hypothetical protein
MRLKTIICLLVAICSSIPVFGQDSIYRFYGTSYQGFLREVAAGGNLDDDGIPDFILSEVFATVFGTQNTGRISAYSGRTGTLLYFLSGVPGQNHKFGHELDFIGDINGDGRTDFIASDPFASFNGIESGRVTVHSGVDGAVLFTYDGNPDLDFDGSGDFLGFAISGAGDANNDGTPDFMYGRPGNYIAGGACSAANDSGEVVVRSGVDGTVIFNITGQPFCRTLGFSLDGVGDVNGDGYDDIVVGHDNAGLGQVIVAGGSPPAIIHVIDGLPRSFLGHRVFGAGDVNGDGTADFAAFSFVFDASFNPLPGELTIFSGVDASAIHHLTGQSNHDRFGAGFEPVEDLDGDGKDEFLIGAWGADPNGGSSGILELFNGADASSLFSWNGSAAGNGVGDHGTFAPLGDVNFDGKLDVVATRTIMPIYQGQADVFTVRDLPLEVLPHTTSISYGSYVHFALNAPATESGNTYYLLGSVSGFTPGIELGGGLNLPLNPDIFLQFTLDFDNSPIFGGVGFIDNFGSGSASWSIGAGTIPANLAGVSTYWAYLTYDPGAAAYSFASNHAIHTLIP